MGSKRRATPTAIALVLVTLLAHVGLAAAATPGMARVSGNASYGDAAPDAGVAVEIRESPSGAHEAAYTDEAGNWDAGELPAGTYSVNYAVIHSSGSNRTYESVGSEQVELSSGQDKVLNATLTGARPEGEIVVDVQGHAPPGSGVKSAYVVMPGGSTQYAGDPGAGGHFRLFVPAGSYEVTGAGGSDDAPTMVPVSVLDGHEAAVTIQLQPLPVPPGTVAHDEQQDLAWLNHQRERWGLPGGLISVPTWSQACAAHDAYGKLNEVLEHPENFSLPGSSQGGNWAGLSSVLSFGSTWSEEHNPWMDAPLHLMQLFDPAIGYIGLDDTESWACATTWPGMVRTYPHGTIWTFPADGASGLPPSEFASESPFVPGSFVGIEGLAGRELFVWEEGTIQNGGLKILSASLTSAAGPVEVRVVDQTTPTVGPYLLGGIVLPVKPLQPSTTYTASVTLATVSGGGPPQTTHTWTFTTGPENAGGIWGGRSVGETGAAGPGSSGTVGSAWSSSTSWSEERNSDEGDGSPAGVHPRVVTAWTHGRVRVQGFSFPPYGSVVLRRGGQRRHPAVLAKATVNREGRFRTSFKWPDQAIAFQVSQGGKSIAATFRPRHLIKGG